MVMAVEMGGGTQNERESPVIETGKLNELGHEHISHKGHKPRLDIKNWAKIKVMRTQRPGLKKRNCAKGGNEKVTVNDWEKIRA